MNLCVDVFVIDPDGKVVVLDVPDGYSDLAGFERWRTTVWGSPAVRALGARFFPVLDGDNLQVDRDDVPAFLEECALLRANLSVVAPAAEHLVAVRLNNMERAARRAQEVGGGVLVW